MATPTTTAQGPDQRDAVMPRPLVILGGGEHARVLADAARTSPEAWRLEGHTRSGSVAGAEGIPGLADLGDDTTAARRSARDAEAGGPALILGFGGDLVRRRRVADGLDQHAEWATIVHAAAWVSPTARLEPGAVVLAGAVVNTAAHVGAHAIVNTRAIVEHDVRIGAGSHLAPGAIVGGGARVGEDTMIGLGAVIRDHVSIGDRVVVGMGAVVVDDVPDDVTVIGVPARVRAAERP